MSDDEIEFGPPDPLDDGKLEDADGADAPAFAELTDEEPDRLAAGTPGGDAADAEEASVALFASGAPLELPPDAAADTELDRWLGEPSAPPNATELAELDRLLRAGLSPE